MSAFAKSCSSSGRRTSAARVGACRVSLRVTRPSRREECFLVPGDHQQRFGVLDGSLAKLVLTSRHIPASTKGNRAHFHREIMRPRQLRLASPHQFHDLFPEFWRQAVPKGDKLAECLVLPTMFRPGTSIHVVTTFGTNNLRKTGLRGWKTTNRVPVSVLSRPCFRPLGQMLTETGLRGWKTTNRVPVSVPVPCFRPAGVENN